MHPNIDPPPASTDSCRADIAAIRACYAPDVAHSTRYFVVLKASVPYYVICS